MSIRPATLAAAAAVAAASLLAAAPAFADANLVADGGFESTVLPDGTWGFYDAGNPLSGWTASTGAGDDIEVRHDAAGTGHASDNFVELDSQLHNSAMSQVLATVAGQTYTLSFWYANRAASPDYNGVWPGGVVPASSNGLSFDLGSGAILVPALADNTSPDNQWVEYVTTFVATGPTTLTFAAQGTSDTFGTSLDDVRVVAAVSEPAPLALMAAGLLGLGVVSRRRRQG